MLTVSLRDVELLLARELHHEDVEWVGAWHLSSLYLHAYDLEEVLEVFFIVVPVAAL